MTSCRQKNSMKGHERKTKFQLRNLALAGGLLTEFLLVVLVSQRVRAGGNPLYLEILFPITVFILFFNIFLVVILFYIRHNQILEDKIRESESLQQILLSQKQSKALLEKDMKRLKKSLIAAIEKERKEAGFCGSYEESHERQEDNELEQWDHRYCGNEMVNAVLRFKSRQCRENGIAVSIQVGFPETAGLTDRDLCSLLTNLFDNAIDACGKLPEQRRSIKLQISRHNRYLLIVMRNPAVPGHVFRGPRQGHGLGLEIIKEIAEKYDGQLRCRFEEGVFRAEVVLKVL